MKFGDTQKKATSKWGSKRLWGGWLDTDEGKRWEATGEKVYHELETAKVDVKKLLILIYCHKVPTDNIL